MKKLSASLSPKNWIFERHYVNGAIDVTIKCEDTTAILEVHPIGVSTDTANKIEKVFTSSKTANEVKMKLQALRILKG